MFEEEIQAVMAAQDKVAAIDAKLKKLWSEGKFKIRSKVIYQEWGPAVTEKNKATQDLLAAIERLAADSR